MIKGERVLTIDDVPEVSITRQVGHKTFHSLNTLNEVNNLFFRGLLVQSSNHIVNSLSKDRRQTMSHSGMSEGVLVVPSERWPRWVLYRRVTASDFVGMCT